MDGMALSGIFLYVVLLVLGGSADGLEIVAMESPPFVCTDQLPCKPAILLPTVNNNSCLYGGLRARNGYCVHGYLIDLISVATGPGMLNVSVNLWHTTSKITGGYNNLVREIFSPGSTSPAAALCGNSTCDLAIGDITINWPRRMIYNARFSAPYMDVGLRILGRTANLNLDTFNFNFLQPFTTRLWLLILATLLFITFAIVFVESSHFRARYIYLKPDSSGLSWQEKSISRSAIHIITSRIRRTSHVQSFVSGGHVLAPVRILIGLHLDELSDAIEPGTPLVSHLQLVARPKLHPLTFPHAIRAFFHGSL
jgi:hypothetical protein